MLQQEMREQLTKKIIPFWKKLKDSTYGGFYGFMDNNLVINRQGIKGCILNSRILWFFSNAYLTLQDASLKEYADHAYAFLRDFCYDSEEGGMLWSLTYDGKVEDSTKHTYNIAFAIYALSSYYRAFGLQEAIELAKTLVDTVEEKCFDEKGYKEAQDRAFGPMSNDKLSENGVMADRTMNTLLHVLEAYTEYYLVTKEKRVHDKLEYILEVLEKKIYNPKLHRQEVFFDNEMNSIIDLHSYGHDIETAWLLDRGLDALKDEAYKKEWDPVVADLVAEVYKDAYYNHSLSNECERGVVDTKRVWWVQAEGVVGFYNEYQKHPEHTEYLKASEDIWEFIKTYFIDGREGSEWFMHVSDEGKPDTTQPIVEPWKCPYHNGRMCMEIMRRMSK